MQLLPMLLTKRKDAKGLAKSSYQSRFDPNKCIGCGVCEERCAVGAFVMAREIAQLDAEKCIGCGLCVSRCPSGAITLEKRYNYENPPASIGDLVQKIVAHKKKEL
jgi:ferredoxin